VEVQDQGIRLGRMMKESQLQLIKEEIEKIEKSSGHGQVVIKIQDGKIHLIQPTVNILMLDNFALKV